MPIEDFTLDIYKLEGEDAEVGVRHRYTLVKDDTREPVVDAEASQMLAVLLIKEKAFLNDHWWEDDWPEAAKRMPSVNVSCNDVFMWGCADAETIAYRDIPAVYEHFEKDPDWGVDVWCIKHRGMMPQKPVYDRIKAGGIWDLDAMGLEPNPTWKPRAPAKKDEQNG